MKKQRNIPTPLGLAFLLGSLLVGVFFIGLKTSYEADLSAGEIPEEVQVTNVDDRSFTVSWVTKNPSLGSVSYGESPAFGKIEAEGDPSFVHHVRVENLTPSSKYFFEIVSGEESYGDFGAPYTVYTGPFLGLSSSSAEVVYGTVSMPTGRPEPALVYLTFEGSQVFSTVTNPQGGWAMTLSSVRVDDLSSYFPLAGGAPLKISVRANARDVALAKISLEAARPVPEMRLGESYDFSDISLARSAQTPLATLQIPQLLGASSEKVQEQKSESRKSLFLLTPYVAGSIIGLGLFVLGLLVGGSLFSRVKFFRKAKPLS